MMGAWLKKKRSPERDPTSLGNILLSGNYITQAQLSAALAQPGRLGQALVKMGAITQDQLQDALTCQECKRGQTTMMRIERQQHLRTVLSSSNRIFDIAEDLVKRRVKP